jgi:hypothetical protein
LSEQQEEKTPEVEAVDPGCLPAWEVDDLPEPRPFHARNLLALIGPGIVMAGASTGTGEYIIGPRTAAQYHGAMMWVVLLSILAQVVLNTEVMRYTLCTGEPIMTGYLRCRPGPRFWIIFYLFLDVAGWLPTLASLAAQILIVLVLHITPQDTINPDMVQMLRIGIFLFCAFLVLFGGKVYNTLQLVLGGKFLFVLVFMIISSVFFCSAHTWGQIWGGMLDPTRLPLNAQGQPEIDWALVASLAGFAGVGGLGNIMVSNYVRENGWGMGQKVGAIPSAFGGLQIELSHIGTIARNTTENLRRFRGWCKYLIADQYLVWMFGSLMGVMLPSILGAQYLNVEGLDTKDQWRGAAALAQDFGAARGEIFRNLTLICGLIIMIPGQFGSLESVARRWTDTIWSGSRRIRKLDNNRIKHVYYGFAFAYVVFGVLFYVRFPNLTGTTMMTIAGNLANFAIALTIFHTLYVNRRFLPPKMRPSIGKQIALVLAGLFFVTMFSLVFQQKIWPIVAKNWGL